MSYRDLACVVPQFASVGTMQPLNKLTDIVRNELAQAGADDVHAFVFRCNNVD
jgi:hypothetical protein